MSDQSTTKVDAERASKGPQGQRYLASGEAVSMRLWDGEAPGEGEMAQRAYETVGYVISGRAELVMDGKSVDLKPGVSWLVPKGVSHRYDIKEAFTAVEATHPPAERHDRDAAPK